MLVASQCGGMTLVVRWREMRDCDEARRHPMDRETELRTGLVESPESKHHWKRDAQRAEVPRLDALRWCDWRGPLVVGDRPNLS